MPRDPVATKNPAFPRGFVWFWDFPGLTWKSNWLGD